MKKYLLLGLIAFTISKGFSAQYVLHTWTYGGLSREYYLYVPNSYDSTKPTPFILALHGLGDTISNFIGIDMNLVADTANFIFAVPQAITDPTFGASAWNSGAGEFGLQLNPTVDDVGFLNAIIDSTSAYFNIDQKRVYCTGFSMGGFMTNRLGCQLNNRIAAIASVSGTIGTYTTCSPTRAVPSCHFHGTADPVVGFSNDMYGLGAWALVDYWRNHDNCDTTPLYVDTLPHVYNDSLAFVHYKYANGNFGTHVEFYEVINGVHEWIIDPNINYSVAIWQFFRQFTWTDQPTAIAETPVDNAVKIYPNPASDIVNIQYAIANSTTQPQLTVTDFSGRIIFKGAVNTSQNLMQLHVKNWAAGLYTYNIANAEIGSMARGIFEITR